MRKPYIVTIVRRGDGVQVSQSVVMLNADDIQRLIDMTPKEASIRIEPDYSDIVWRQSE